MNFAAWPRGVRGIACFAAMFSAAMSCHAGPSEGARPNVLVITLDTTRADHLGCYGYTRPTSPHLDKLCEQSQVYTQAIATSSWTLPSHASLFTGKFPSSHGAIYHEEGPLALTDAIEGPVEWGRLAVQPLSEGEVTLAELLVASGYRTGAVVAGPWTKRIFGLSQGFESYDESDITSLAGRRADSVTRGAIEFIEQAEAEDATPFFLFVNYYDPHVPYSAPKEFSRGFVRSLEGGIQEDPAWRKVALYDAEIRYMDSQIGRLMARLRELGEFEPTLILVTADHGQLLGERDLWGHGYYLSQQELQIPFILKPPGGADAASPSRIDVPVQLVDVLPTILDWVGLPAQDGIQGGLLGQASHPIVAEVYPRHTERYAGDWWASFRGTTKLLCNSLGNHALFDLAHDPGEKINLIGSPASGSESDCEPLRQYLGSLPPPAPYGGARLVDEETRKALESLGYLE